MISNRPRSASSQRKISLSYESSSGLSDDPFQRRNSEAAGAELSNTLLNFGPKLSIGERRNVLKISKTENDNRLDFHGTSNTEKGQSINNIRPLNYSSKRYNIINGLDSKAVADETSGSSSAQNAYLFEKR